MGTGRGRRGAPTPVSPCGPPSCRKRDSNPSGPAALIRAGELSLSRFLLGLCLAPLPEDAPRHLAGAASGPHRCSPPTRPRRCAVSGSQAALPGRHTVGRGFNDKNPLSRSSAGRESGLKVLAGRVLVRPPCHPRPLSRRVPTQPLSCATWRLLPLHGDASPVSLRPHPRDLVKPQSPPPGPISEFCSSGVGASAYGPGGNTVQPVTPAEGKQSKAVGISHFSRPRLLREPDLSVVRTESCPPPLALLSSCLELGQAQGRFSEMLLGKGMGKHIVYK